MLELPLFPLNTVLFPATLIHLHIFEDRYKQMINQCLDSKQPFGVVSIAEGQEAYGLARPSIIGCTAHIARIQPLEHGRMEITAVGLERFEIQSLHHNRPYLVGSVALCPIDRSQPQLLAAAVDTLRPLVTRYISLLSLCDSDFRPPKLPPDPVALVYLAASLLQQIPLEQKQRVLNIDDALKLVSQVQTLYQFETKLLEAMMNRIDAQDDTDFLDSIFSDN